MPFFDADVLRRLNKRTEVTDPRIQQEPCTLDQSYHLLLNEEESKLRESSQVVTNYIRKQRDAAKIPTEPDESKLLMVNQLWIWELDSGESYIRLL